jgi:hypothetical protein
LSTYFAKLTELPVSVKTTIKRPSGFVPLAMSGAALTVVLLRLALFGAAPEPDEGAAAHLWQILMTCQAPTILFFAIRWLRSDPRGTMSVLGFQLLAIAVAMAPIYFLKW